jgi:hypothetical protein
MLFDAEGEKGLLYGDELTRSLAYNSQHNEDDVHLNVDKDRSPIVDEHSDQEIDQLLYRIRAVDPAHEKHDIMAKGVRESTSPSRRNSDQRYHLVFGSSSVDTGRRQSASPVSQTDDMLRSSPLADNSNQTPTGNQRSSSLAYLERTPGTSQMVGFQPGSAEESVWMKFLSIPISVSGRSDVDSQRSNPEEQVPASLEQTSLVTYPASAKAHKTYNVDSSVRVTQSPSASLRNIMALAAHPPVQRVTGSGSGGASEEELWIRFVFGDEKESTPSLESQDREITRTARPNSRPPASSLSVEVSTTSSGGTGDPLIKLSLEDDQQGPLGLVSRSAKSADRSDHDLNEASMRTTYASSDRPQIRLPGAGASKDRTSTASLARFSMYNNISELAKTSSDDRRDQQ